MLALSIGIDGIRNVEQALKRAQSDAIKAGVSAINKTVAQARTQAVRELAGALKLTARIVRSRAVLVRASARKQFAILRTLTAGVPVDRLRYVATRRRGVTAAGRRFGSAFAALMPQNAGRPLVMQRRGAARLPIERVKIPLQPDADRIFSRQIQRHIKTVLNKIFEREFKFRLSRR